MKEETIDFSQFAWLNPPEGPELENGRLEFVTAPDTDFWQRTHYGFRRNTGHAFLTRLWDDFSFSVGADFFYESLFDQCGLFLYQDEDNWAKMSIEYEDEAFSQLGSVVTTRGYSDWACSPIATDVTRMYYRLSRRGNDFRFDCSPGGGDAFRQLRVFHLHGDLALARVGVYACSPQDSSFRVRFFDFTAGASIWHG